MSWSSSSRAARAIPGLGPSRPRRPGPMIRIIIVIINVIIHITIMICCVFIIRGISIVIVMILTF